MALTAPLTAPPRRAGCRPQPDDRAPRPRRGPLALRIGALLLTVLVLPGAVRQKVTVAGGGGQYISTVKGCEGRRELIDLGEVGLLYEAEFFRPKHEDELRWLLGARLGATFHRVAIAGDVPRGTREWFPNGAFWAGVWAPWADASVGLFASDPEGWDDYDVPLLYPSGRLRLFPERYFYVTLESAWGPLVLTPGMVRVSGGTRALDPLRVELLYALTPSGIAALRLGADLGDHVSLGALGGIGPTFGPDNAQDWARSPWAAGFWVQGRL